MRYKTLGRSGLVVSELCLGCMTFGGGGFWQVVGQQGQDEADGLIKASLDAGINFFDTANVYSDGASETILGQSLRNLDVPRGEVVVATKVLGRMGKGPNMAGASRGHILNEIERSLERLQTDYVDLYQVHGIDPSTPIEETIDALDILVRRGVVRYIGLSNWAAWQIAKAIGISERKGQARVTSLQAYYTVAGRDLERELAPMMASEGVGLMVWSPLAGGLLSGKFDRDNQSGDGGRRASFDFPLVDKERAWEVIDALRAIAEAKGATVAQVALAWLLHQPAVTSVIVGAKRPEQLADNLGAVDVTLSDEDLAALDAVSKLPPEYPGWMTERQATYRFGDGMPPPPKED